MNTRTLQAAALCVALALSTQTRSAELTLPKDGWASWQVDAVEDAPDWCCWESWDTSAPPATCKLDEDRNGYGSRDHRTTDSVRLYAHLVGGKVDRLRSLAANCPVEARTPIRDLGAVAADDSARWLITLAKDAKGSSAIRGGGDDVLASLAMHRSDLAFDALAVTARNDASVETRKHAVLWLAMMRGNPGAEVTSSVMFSDKDADLRKHAAMAMAQSKSPRMAQDLIRLGQTDRDGDVRAQAWFWLAHTGAPNAEDSIVAALKKDQNDHVREQAVFALSQLPDERATRALIATAENQALPREQRKRALFWLAQSDSAGAQNYLERVLAGNVAR